MDILISSNSLILKIYSMKSFNKSLKWLIVLRVALGIMLFLRGIQFIYDDSLVKQLFHEQEFLREYFWLQTMIPWAHLLGGFLIILGVYTRLAVIVQMPIVAGAIFFTSKLKEPAHVYSSLTFAIVVFALLIVFLFIGDGAFSWKKMIDKEHHQEA
jgi:uncharacterized membrane protein YphA (DoxX/SURF4 family)